MSNCNTRIKLILLISMLFSLTIGQMWADMYLAGSMNDWAQTDATKFVDNKIEVTLAAETTYEFKIVDSGKWRSCDASITNTSLNYELDKENVDGYNISITTGEAGTYIFQYSWYDGKHHFSVYYPQSRLKKNTVLYFDGRNSTKGWGTYTWGARFFYKYYDSGGDHSNLDCTSAVESYVHYTTVPNHDYLGQIQVERKNPSDMDGTRWNYTGVCCAYSRANSGQNCMAISNDNKDWDDTFIPVWTTYCPPISSVTMTDNGSTLYGGNGSAGTPYLIEAGDPIRVHVTEAVSAVDDGNMIANYQFKDGASNIGDEGTGTSASKTSGSSGTTHTIIVEARNKYNGAAGTLARCTLYYETKTVYTGLSVAKSGDDSKASAPTISQTWAIATNSVTVTATVPDGYYFTGWTSSNGSFGDATALSTTFTPTADNAVATATYALRWAISTSYDEWSTNDHIIGNISTSAGVTSGYVDITLPANTGYELKVFDKTNHWLGHTTSGVTLTYSNSGTKYAMAEGNYNLGFTTAGAGSYRFTWDITNSKVSVTYPTSYYVTAAGNPAAGGTVTPSSATYMSTSVGGEITATPNYAHYFNGWTSSAGGTFTSASSATTTFKPASAAATVTAAFPERTAFIEGNFQVYNSTRATRTKTGDSWQDASTAIKMTYDSENNRYYLHTYSTPAELAEQLNSADAYFYVKTSTSSSSIANDATYKAHASSYQSLATYGSANKKPTGTSEHSFKFTGSEDGYVILYFNGTHVWYELECALSYYGGDGATGDAPAARTYYAYGSNQTAASNTYSKTGYTFNHWDTAADDSGSDYAAGATNVAMNAREVCLHAQWTAKEYTINLANMEATTAGTTSVTVTFDASANMTASDPITKPTKTHYDFAGYWTSENTGATLDHQLIGADGKWIKDVEGYTSHDGAGNPTWVHDYPISLYAKWTEHEYAITMEVSPAGTGTTSPASTAIGKLVTESGNITATPAAGYKFKEWQFSKTDENYDAWCADGYSSTDATIHIKAQHNGTLTAVFEERYSLVGSLQDNSGNGGMPGWVDYTKTFTVNSSSPVDLTRTCTLQANKTYKLQVHDLATSTNLGRSGCAPVCVLEENASLVMENSNNDVFLYTSGAGEYIFKITAVDGSGHPTLTVLRPYPVNFGQKYEDIDGTLHAGTTGGTAAASAGGALTSGDYVTYNTSVTHTATAESGYTFAGWWDSDAFGGNNFSETNPMTYAVTHGDNAYAKFVETSTAVTLANDGNGKVQIGGADATSTTCGVTTTRSLTAVPNDGYMFSSWTKTSGDDITISSTSTNPTTLTGRGSGLSEGQEVTANYTYRWALKAESAGWGESQFIIENISTVSGDVVGYVEISLAANTDYEFTMKDLLTNDIYKNNSVAVQHMTYTNHTDWGFGTDKTYNCGITTAGRGTYRFTWNITDKTMTVTYPNSYVVNLGVKSITAEGTEGSLGTVVATDASSNTYTNGQYIASGETVTVTATAPSTYTFVGWWNSSAYTGEHFATANPTSWTVGGDVNAYAKFTEDTNTFSTTSGNNWSTTANWSAGHVPTLNEVAIVTAPVTVNITNAKAKRVLLMQNSSNTGRIEIPAGKELIVKETVRKTTDGSSYGATAANDIYIGSNASNGLGALVMGSHDGTNKATVDFYTTSYGDKNNNTSVAQYVGTPFNDETNILYNWHNSWIYGIKYTNNTIGWDRVNEGQGMDPFRGYCVFSADAWNNAEGHSYWQQGTLVASENHTCSSLNYQSGTYTNPNNENLLANSWMAPIYIKAMETGDFVKTEATIYIFNSTSAKGFVSLANNYTAYTVNTADEVIPAMQSFSVFTNASGGSSVTLDYNKIVYTPAVNGTATPTANKAPRRAGYTEDEADKMKLFVSTKSGYGDMLYMWERADFVDGFENGWDGHKLFGESVAPQLYAITPDGYMAVNCVPDWEGAVVGFRKGTEDNVYTFSFEYEGDGTWYLNDLKDEQSTLISSDNTYMFTATDNDEARFIISRTPIQYVPTGTERSDISNQTSAVRKLIIDEHVYIIRGGRMYDATGVPVK